MKKIILLSAVLCLGTFVGCMDIKVDTKVPDYSGRSHRKVDSSRVPKTSSHKDCREKLNRAYEYIGSLERKVKKCEKKIDKLEQDKKKLKKEKSQLKDKLERYEDD